MISSIDASTVIRERYEAWANALRMHEFHWLEENLADDYQFSARPYPNMLLDKAGFIEADRKMQSADIRFVMVHAFQCGETIISTTVADVTEAFSGELGAHMPSLGEINALVGGGRLAYASAWRRSKGRWLCFHHHMIGPVDG